MTPSSQTASPQEVFEKRVRGCASLRGLLVSVTWLTPLSATFSARHPYGPLFGVTVFEFDPLTHFCQSENGALMRHSDVAYRLKQRVTDKAFRAEAKAREKRKEAVRKPLDSPSGSETP